MNDYKPGNYFFYVHPNGAFVPSQFLQKVCHFYPINGCEKSKKPKNCSQTALKQAIPWKMDKSLVLIRLKWCFPLRVCQEDFFLTPFLSQENV